MSRLVGLVNIARDTVEEWKDDLRKLGPETGKSLNELGEALFFISSAGLRGQEALDALEVSAKASAAGLGETKAIADLVTSAMNAYASSGLSSAEATDILVAAVREGKAEAPAFATALGKVLPITAEMKVSFDEVAAAVAAMTKSGLNVAEATTSLRGILNALLKPADQAQEAFEKMGTSAEALRQEIKDKGLLSAMETIRTLTEKYGVELSSVITETEALAGFLNLMGENLESTRSVFAGVENSAGSLDKAFDAVSENFKQSSKILSSQLNVALENLGVKLLPLATSAFNALAGAIGFLNDPTGLEPAKNLENIAKQASSAEQSIALLSGATDRYSEMAETATANANAFSAAIRKQSGEVTFLQQVLNKLRPPEDAAFLFGLPLGSGRAEPAPVTNMRQLGAVIQTIEGDMSQLAGVAGEVEEELKKTSETVNELAGGDGGGGLSEAADEAKQLAEELENLADDAVKGLQDRLADTQRELESIGASAEKLRELEMIALRAQIPWDTLNKEQLAEAERLLKEIGKVAAQIDFKNAVRDMVEQVDQFGAEIEDSLEEGTEKGKEALDSLDDFIGGVAANISDTVADMLTAAFTGNFDGIKRSWKDLMDNMLNVFFQFVSAIITNPIRIALEGALGGEGAKGGGADIFGGFKALFNNFKFGFESFKSVLSGTFNTESIAGTLNFLAQIVPLALGVFELIKGLFKKTPRLDIDFDSVKTELGRRAAIISEILDPEFFADSIAEISVKRGGVGLGAGGDEAIKKLIQERLEQSIESIQAIIAKLPTEIFTKLNETLQSAELDIDTVIAGERLLEFDAKGKKIAEKFQAFIEGELPAKLFAAIRESFFDPAFQALGVSADATQDLIDQFLSDLEGAGSREERGKIGAAFLENFNLFVDAFNVLSGNANDAIGAAVNQVHALSETLGFEAVPSLGELRTKLEQFVRTADVEGVRSILDLRNAIIQLRNEILSSISSIIGNIQSLNATIAAFDGASIDVTGFINQAIGSIMNLLSQPGLSIGEQEGLLGELTGFANQLLAEEQAAFNKAQEAQARAAQARQAAIQNTINKLNNEKSKVEDIFRTRIDALNEELRLIQDLEALVDSIRRNIQDLLLAPGGPESVFERIARAQSEVSRLFSELGSAGPEERIEIAGQIQDLLNELNALRQEGFQAPSLESDALFREIIGGLESLEGLIEPARSSEDIQASIETLTARNQAVLESIDKKIESAQTRLATIGERTSQNTFRMSQELQGLFEFIRSEYIRILEERFDQLGEISEGGFENEIQGLETIADIAGDQLIALRNQTGSLRNIESLLAGMIGFQHGSDGLRDFGRGTLAVLHGREAVVTAEQLASIQDRIASKGTPGGNVNVSLNLPPITFAPGQIVNPDMFMRELLTKLHDRRITDEIVKITRGKV